VFEGRQGKSFALNTGIQQARGDLLAFVDDDVTVAPDWLHQLVAPLMDGKWVGSGGRVFPERSLALPKWVNRNSSFVVGPLVMFDLGATAAPLKEAPFGTNMAFRKELFHKHGGFRTDLGPCPGSEFRGEDSEYARRLLTAGEPLYYEPSAIVYHSVSEQRLTRRYFLAWWFDKGRCDVRTPGPSIGIGSSIAGVPLVFLRRLMVWLLKWTFSVGSAQRFENKLTAWYVAGEILEFYREAGRISEQTTIDDYSHKYEAFATNSGIGSEKTPD
jgi:GT2 family glycosyltransferase